MQRHGWRPDHYTFPFVLKASGKLPSFLRGASVHAVVCANGFETLSPMCLFCNAVVAMYGRCGAFDEARQVFDDLCERGICDVVSWNTIVAAYVQGGDPRNALKLSDRMIDDRRICPDAVSVVNILPACASVRAWSQVKEVHGFAVRSGLVEDVFVGNAVVDMHACFRTALWV
ncbi:hypothetical protein CJ030_MR1G028629 [Morella rubra]|uniref:Pentatricopeptide repeat-containing protein n=1 Tax=Morella rubra TaxID=262757 RepID=A0A6A1WHG7_9ROSI|nr:hypothetical protein CJ030_MR1G028629 [Morella rubra]